MKKTLLLSLMAGLLALTLTGCGPVTSDQQQQQQQEQLLAQGTEQTGMPDIKNFRERKLMKLILEKRDQDGLVTYTYLENMVPTVVAGHTALGGKLTYVGQSVGFPIPYATQYTNPQKFAQAYSGNSYEVIAQADPNGLFSPADAEGTWVLLLDPQTKQIEPEYFEPRLVCLTYQLPLD